MRLRILIPNITKGFTILELIIVIAIIGILATLGLSKYQSTVEKSRGAEAKAIIGDIRKAAYVYWLKYETLVGIPQYDVNIGTLSDQIPIFTSNCRPSHYFRYSIGPSAIAPNNNKVNIYASRCTVGGKPPQAPANYWIELTSDFDAGTDIWNSSTVYR